MSPAPRRRLRRAAAGAAVIMTAVVGVLAASPGDRRSVEAVGEVDPIGAGGEFHSLTPTRIFDSRDVGAKRIDTVSANAVFDLPVVGRGGLPDFVDDDLDGYDDRVLAVVVTVAVIRPTRAGYLQAYPAGATPDTTSVVNFQSTTVANSAVLRPGIGGQISMRLVTSQSPGTADVTVDISGWFSTSVHPDRGARLTPISPVRAYDSNEAQYGGRTLVGRSQTTVQIRGLVDPASPTQPAVPDDPNVSGVVVNVIGVNKYAGSGPTYISALPMPVPADVDEAPASTVNLSPGQTRANLAILPVDANGAIHLFNRRGEIRLVVDVMGYLVDGQPVATRAGRVVPLVAPFRAFDTRQVEFLADPLGPGRAEDWSFDSFVHGVNVDGAWVGEQSGLIANLTATGLQRQYPWAPVVSYMTAYPTPAAGDDEPPLISNLNFEESQSVGNLAVLGYGGTDVDPYQLRFYNRAGYVHYILDVYAVVLTD